MLLFIQVPASITNVVDNASYRASLQIFQSTNRAPLFFYHMAKFLLSSTPSSALYEQRKERKNWSSPPNKMTRGTAAAPSLSPSPLLSPPVSPQTEALRGKLRQALHVRDTNITTKRPECVLTDQPDELHAVHVIGAGEETRTLFKDSKIPPELKQYIPPSYLDQKTQKLLANFAMHKLVGISNWYDPKLALLMRSKYNQMFANGHCWVDDKECIAFSDDALASDPSLSQYNHKPLRKPTDPEQLKLWPPKEVFQIQQFMAPLLREQIKNPYLPPDRSPNSTTGICSDCKKAKNLTTSCKNGVCRSCCIDKYGGCSRHK